MWRTDGDCDRFGAGLAAIARGFRPIALVADASRKFSDIAKEASGRARRSKPHAGEISRNMTEHEIAGALDAEVRNRGLLPVVTLVAADDRVAKYRHPIPTGPADRHGIACSSRAHRSAG